MPKTDIREIRLQNLLLLLDEHNNNRADLARTLHKAPAQLTQWFNRTRTISEESAREIEDRCKKPAQWLDREQGKSGTAEPTPRTSVGDPWPFASINPHQLRRLSPAALRFAEDQIKALLRFNPQDTAATWREVAMELAVHADVDAGETRFTEFCKSVDRMVAKRAKTGSSAPSPTQS